MTVDSLDSYSELLSFLASATVLTEWTFSNFSHAYENFRVTGHGI